MECFHASWIKILSGWRHISSSDLSLKNAGLTLGFFWGRGARTTFTVWLWTWSTVIMAMLVASWSSLGKFFVPLAVRHLLCRFLGGQTPLSSATGSILRAHTFEDCWIIQLSVFACWGDAYKNCLHIVRDASPLFDDGIHRYSSQGRWRLWLDAV